MPFTLLYQHCNASCMQTCMLTVMYYNTRSKLKWIMGQHWPPISPYGEPVLRKDKTTLVCCVVMRCHLFTYSFWSCPSQSPLSPLLEFYTHANHTQQEWSMFIFCTPHSIQQYTGLATCYSKTPSIMWLEGLRAGIYAQYWTGEGWRYITTKKGERRV